MAQPGHNAAAAAERTGFPPAEVAPLPFHRSLPFKHAVFVALLVILTTGTLGHLAYVFSRDLIQRDVDERMTLIVRERARLFEASTALRLEQAASMAGRLPIESALRARLSDAGDASLRRELIHLQESLRTDGGTRWVLVVDPRGDLLATGNAPEAESPQLTSAELSQGLRGPQLTIPRLERGRLRSWATAPIVLNDDEEASGVLLVESDVTDLIAAVADHAELGTSGRAMLGWKSEGKVRPVGRAESDRAVAPEIVALLEAAAEGPPSTRLTSVGGSDVIVAQRPVRCPSPDHGRCSLVARVDAAEAYAPVVRLRRTLLLLQAALLLAGVGAAFAVARRLSTAINRLSETAASISAGNLRRRAAVTSRDEIGLLSGSFDRMTDQFTDSQVQLERRVEARTAELIESQKELKRQTRILKSVLDSMADGVVVADAQGKFLVWNTAADRIIGIGPLDVAPGEWSAVYGCYLGDGNTRCPPEELPLARAIRGESLDDFALFVRNASVPDGVWISVNARPLKNSVGELRGGVAVFRDVSAARKANEEIQAREEINRAILATAHEAFIAIDRNSVIRQWNGQAERTFGWSAGEALGRKITETIIPERYAEAHLKGIERFFATGEGAALNRRIELSARHRDGREFPVETTIAPVWQGNSWLFAAFIHDISDQKRAQQELERAREKAEAGSRAKSEFLANMSHEIRTPLNAIIGMTELVLDTRLTPTQQDYLTMVQESGESLLAVINDILDFSKIESGRFELDLAPFDLREVLGDTMKTLAVRAHRKGLELAYHVDPAVPKLLVGDRHRLRQVVVNLVGNAVKFTDEGEVVLDVTLASADASSTKASGVSLHISVSDTGMGIPPEKQQIIFQAFEQADESSTRRFSGTGLGLAICSRLVAMMGGRIWVESEVGKGSTFHFTAEFGIATGAPESSHGVREAVLHGVRVLVVDDNRTNCRILNEVLRNWDMRPTVAMSGAEALVALHREVEAGMPFDLVLVDGHMPGMDGFSLMEAIRQEASFDTLGAVMLTSSGQRDTARSERLRISAFLTKPVKQSELFDAVCDCLGGSAPTGDSLEQSRTEEIDARLPPLRILLAEDNVVNQKLALGLLEPLGHTVSIAENGMEALRAWECGEFDLILMDVQMPEMDGLEATRTIRQRESATGAHIPILAMTAHAIKGDRERCLAAGMDDYLSKPVRARDLYAAIERLAPRDLGEAEPHPSPAPLPSVEESRIVSEAAAPATTASTPDAVSRFDWNAALARSDLRVSDFRELSELFIEQCPVLLAEIRTALSAGDFVSLRRAAHTLKGSEGIFLGDTGDTFAWQLERAARDGDRSAAEAAIPKVEEEAGKLSAALLKRLRQT